MDDPPSTRPLHAMNQPRPLRPAILLALAWLLLPLAGCRTPPAQTGAGAAPQPYLRIARPSTGSVELQIASRKFLPARGNGPAIWLVGASHIGESNYYAALQRQLDAQTLVLYEGVGEHPRRARRHKTDPAAPAPRPSRPPAATAKAEDDGLQATMARSLGLVFQLNVMRYDRTHFFNSDLSIAEIQALMGSQPAPARGAKPAPGAGEEDNNAFQELLRAMDGSSAFGAIMRGMMQFIGSSAKLQAMTKLALIEVLGTLRADPTRLRGVPPDMKRLLEVLIHERNKAVVEDLKFELKQARRQDSIAIFYGAGHLPDLEQRLRTELRYRPAEDLWHAAFAVNPAEAGLSSFELSFLQSLLRTQLAPLTD